MSKVTWDSIMTELGFEHLDDANVRDLAKYILSVCDVVPKIIEFPKPPGNLKLDMDKVLVEIENASRYQARIIENSQDDIVRVLVSPGEKKD